MDRFGDRLGAYHSTWLATSISCCLLRSRERPHPDVREDDQEETLTMDREIASVPARATTIKRQSPIPVSKYNVSSVCYQQPTRRSQLSCPKFETEDPRIQAPRPVSSRRNQPTWPDRRQSVHSKASQRTRPKSGRSLSRRPTISNPTDFRKSDASSFEFLIHENELLRAVSPIQRTLSPFRPLQLSIYLPGNELPALPRFSDDDEVPPVPGLERPQQALMMTKSEPIVSRRLSSFSIPRKPVGGSRTNSMELSSHVPRTSIDSGLTLNNNDGSTSAHKHSSSIERLHSDHRPSLSAAKSAYEFLEMINAPLPPLPQSTPTSHQTGINYAPKTACSIYRSASDQNLRLQTHLEERQATIQAWETISEREERSPVSPLTPPQPQITAFATSTTSRNSQIFVQKSVQQHADSTGLPALTPQQQQQPYPNPTDHPAWTDSNYEFPPPTTSFHKPRSSAGSSTLFNEKAAEAGILPLSPRPTKTTNITTDPSVPTVTTTISVRPATPSNSNLSTRLSAWLARSIATLQQASTNDVLTSTSSYSEPNARASNPWDLSYPAPLTVGAGAVAIPGEIQKTRSAPAGSRKGTPLVQPGGESRVSTYVSAAEELESEVVDVEKLAPQVVVTERGVSGLGVGVAF